MKILIRRIAWVGGVGIFFLAGCATVGEMPTTVPLPVEKGAYHKVLKGETLWRIAQNYNVEINDLKRINHIPDAGLVEVGQLIRIPGAQEEKPIAPFVQDLNSKEFAWPAQGRVVEYFGDRKSGISSKSIGIALRDGEKVTASRQGKVVFADYLSGYAYTVIIDHTDGYSSVYTHNAKIFVKNGDQVLKGEKIAEPGAKGIVHFQIRHNSLAENPLYFLPKT